MRALADFTKERMNIRPQTNLPVLRFGKRKRKSARILASNQHVPFMAVRRIDYLLAQVKKGLVLTASELLECADFLRSGRLMKQFFEKNRYQTALLFQYSQALPDLTAITEHIEQDIQNRHVSDSASAVLRKARRKSRRIRSVFRRWRSFCATHKNKEWIQNSWWWKKARATPFL